jgi:hypothetical protein
MFWARDDFSSDPVYDELVALSSASDVTSDSFNIYYFGGSSMKGSPYSPEISIPRILTLYLGGTIRDKPIRNVIVAKASVDIAYNLNRMRIIANRKDEFHPSLFVIYSGHNEYLKFNRPSCTVLGIRPKHRRPTTA